MQAKTNHRYHLPPSRELYACNIHPCVPPDQIYSVFVRFGPVERVRLFASRGYAFVLFARVEDALRALYHMARTPIVIAGQMLKVSYARARRETPHGLCQQASSGELPLSYETRNLPSLVTSSSAFTPWKSEKAPTMLPPSPEIRAQVNVPLPDDHFRLPPSIFIPQRQSPPPNFGPMLYGLPPSLEAAHLTKNGLSLFSEPK